MRQGRGYGPAMCAMNVAMCATDADMCATIAVMYAKDAVRCAKHAATCGKVEVTCGYVRNRRGFVRQKRDRFPSALNSPRFPVAFPSLFPRFPFAFPSLSPRFPLAFRSEPGRVAVCRTEKVLHSVLLASNFERMPAAAPAKGAIRCARDEAMAAYVRDARVYVRH